MDHSCNLPVEQCVECSQAENYLDADLAIALDRLEEEAYGPRE